MRVERQVVGEQVDVMAEQAGQTRLASGDDPAVLAAPEPAVMHDDSIGPAGDGAFYQGKTGGDAEKHLADLVASFHLQAVWAIIAESRGVQQFIQIALKLNSLHCLSRPDPSLNRSELCAACG